MFKHLQNIGKSFMLPIAILPAAGLLLGIGGALSNVNTIKAYPALDIGWLQVIFQVMSAAGSVIFGNLAMILCVGLGIGLAKRDKATAGLASVVAFLVMNATIKGIISATGQKISIDTGVVGAIAIGFMVSYLHNTYREVKLHDVLAFFGGNRFIPIISSFAAMGVGLVFYMIWPTFQGWLVSAGHGIAGLGIFGSFLYEFLLRLTGAVGLHHMIYPLFWLTELGGVEQVAGQTVVGAQKIFFAQLADPNHTGLYTEGTRFFAGRFAVMMFGLPASCLAMYHCAHPEKREMVAGLFISAALTSFVTGITEPIEYMFLFVAPWLYVIHAFFDGISFLIADWLNISIGNTFSGGVIDLTLFGILPGNAFTNWTYLLIVGPAFSVLYYMSFRFLITKFNVPTPGREYETEDGEEVVSVSNDNTVVATALIQAFGGADNIEEVDACITRLRVSVKDTNKVDEIAIKKQGAMGVIKVQGGVQAIYGARADKLKTAMQQILGGYQ